MPDMPSHHATTTTTVDLPMQVRAAEFVPESYDAAAGTIDVVWTTGARGVRLDKQTGEVYDEELSLDPSAVDLSILSSGRAPMLDTHGVDGVDRVLGVVVSARIGVATVRLSVDPQKAGKVADIRAGIIRSVSVGYVVRAYLRIEPWDRKDGGTRPLLIAVDWVPHELSFVPVPFDTGCATRAADPHAPAAAGHQCVITARSAAAAGAGANTTTGVSMPQTIDAGSTAPASPAAEPVQQQRQAEPAAPAARTAGTDAAEIISLCRTGGLGLEHAEAMLREGLTPDQASRRILQQRAADDRAAGGHLNVQAVRDEGETRLRGLGEVLMHRLDPSMQITGEGREFRGLSLLEMGTEALRLCGVNVRGMTRQERVAAIMQQRSSPGYMSTADFSLLLGGVGQRRLAAAYTRVAPTYQAWAAQAPNMQDLRGVNILRIGDAPELLDVSEAGEYRQGAFREAAESYKPTKGGRLIALTEEMLINDDLRAFDRAIVDLGSAAARRENRLVYKCLSQKMGDGKTVFHADHANVTSTAGLTIEGLRDARKLMRKQRSLGAANESGQPLGLSPAFLLVPSDYETEAHLLTSAVYQPTTASATNEFGPGGRNSLQPIVEPLLDDDPTAWYLLADASAGATVEWCYLDGQVGPQLSQRMGWEVDGLEWKVKHWFACAATDYRGMVRNKPAA